MNAQIHDLIQILLTNIDNVNFINIADSVVEKLDKLDDSYEAIPLILKLIEENPYADFGEPGPLVHFVETFSQNGYEEELVKSIKRKPTQHTLWMLNRLINGLNEKQKLVYIELLKKVATSNIVDNTIRQDAEEFYNFQVEE